MTMRTLDAYINKTIHVILADTGGQAITGELTEILRGVDSNDSIVAMVDKDDRWWQFRMARIVTWTADVDKRGGDVGPLEGMYRI